ncbi:MAG: hypothetical protein V4596_14090 [Bdellovibrionota bacterium]
MENELWSETRAMNNYEIIGGILRREFQKEQIKRLNLSYLSSGIDQWWDEGGSTLKSEVALAKLYTLIIETLKSEDLEIIQSVGCDNKKISAVFMEYIFNIPSKELAQLVHEAMSKIGGIIDIKYPYEEHKELFPKQNDSLASDWGKGLGIIRPHSDDLYEPRDINIMSLTVCKDTSKTPTWFWQIKDVIASITNEELGVLALAEANFYSGTNVEGLTLENKKPILRQDKVEGLGLRLDFRVDDSIGPRMRFEDENIKNIITKIREGFKTIKPLSANPSTGSVSILSNFKVLHGRSSLNPMMLYEGESSRILYRSKGIK